MAPKNPGANVHRRLRGGDTLAPVMPEPRTALNLLKRVPDIFGDTLLPHDILSIRPGIIFKDEHDAVQCYFGEEDGLVLVGAHDKLAAEVGVSSDAVRAFLVDTTIERIIFPEVDDIPALPKSEEALAILSEAFAGKARVEAGGLLVGNRRFGTANILLSMPQFIQAAFDKRWDFPTAERELKSFLETL